MTDNKDKASPFRKDQKKKELDLSNGDLKLCKRCGQHKMRYRNGKYPNGKDIRFVDDQGKEWNGHKCPQCQINDAKQNARLKVLAKDIGNDKAKEET